MKETDSIVIRVLGKRGVYPRFPITQRDYVLVNEHDIVWSAVRQPGIEYFDWDPEVYWLHPEEVRVFAGLSLIEPFPTSYGY